MPDAAPLTLRKFPSSLIRLYAIKNAICRLYARAPRWVRQPLCRILPRKVAPRDLAIFTADPWHNDPTWIGNRSQHERSALWWVRGAGAREIGSCGFLFPILPHSVAPIGA